MQVDDLKRRVNEKKKELCELQTDLVTIMSDIQRLQADIQLQRTIREVHQGTADTWRRGNSVLKLLERKDRGEEMQKFEQEALDYQEQVKKLQADAEVRKSVNVELRNLCHELDTEREALNVSGD